MRHLAVPSHALDTRPPDLIVDLDALHPPAGVEWRPPVVVEGRIVTHPAAFRSPLDGGGHALTGGVVTDPDEIARIRARVAYAGLPWWRRWRTPKPAGW